MNPWKQFKKLEYEDLLEAALHARKKRKRRHLFLWTTRRKGCLVWRDELEEFLIDNYDEAAAAAEVD